MDELVISSPAKINLYLEIVGRRSDGYHEIETVMQLVDLCDQVRLRRSPRGIRVSVTGADLPPGRGNLACKAAGLLLTTAGICGGVQIHLEKRIPVAAGLGGGSSNAAAVLAGLNRLYELRFSRERLQACGARVGSDVPFFLGDGLALATGRGEVLQPLPPWPRQWLVVANPGIPISTAWAYREASSKLTAWQRRSSIQTLIGDAGLIWPPSWAFNRLEAVVLPHRAEVRALKAALLEGGAFPVLMSGSGGSVFGVVPDASAAEGLAARVRAQGAFAVAATTLPANPIVAPLA